MPKLKEHDTKTYWSTEEIADMENIPLWKVRVIADRLGVTARKHGHYLKFTLKQVQQIIMAAPSSVGRPRVKKYDIMLGLGYAY